MWVDLQRYARRVFRSGFAIWDQHVGLTVLISAAISGLIALLSAYALRVTFGFDTVVFYAAFIVLWFVFVVLVITPFRIWREDAARIEALEEMAIPKIKVIDVLETTEPHQSYGKSIRTFYLIVKNTDKLKRHLDNCLFQIVQLSDQNGNTSPYPRVALRTMYQTPPAAGPFRLRPSQVKYVMVARLDEKDPSAKIELGYADPQRYQPWLEKDKTWSIEIEGYADIGESRSGTYKLWVDVEGRLIFRQAG